MFKKVRVHDRMQKDYAYELVCEPGRDFAADFKPQLIPAQMLAMGVFGGKYMTDCTAEFPAQWFLNAKLSPEKHDANLNFFQVKASKPLSYWQD